jgi:hypothetical protein
MFPVRYELKHCVLLRSVKAEEVQTVLQVLSACRWLRCVTRRLPYTTQSCRTGRRQNITA